MKFEKLNLDLFKSNETSETSEITGGNQPIKTYEISSPKSGDGHATDDDSCLDDPTTFEPI